MLIAMGSLLTFRTVNFHFNFDGNWLAPCAWDGLSISHVQDLTGKAGVQLTRQTQDVARPKIDQRQSSHHGRSTSFHHISTSR